MRRTLKFACCLAMICLATADAEELDPAHFNDGELAGSLKSSEPIAVYDADPQSLANRVFAAFYIRRSEISTKRGGTPVKRIEGGDVLDFLAWPGSDYWSTPETCQKLNALLEECLDHPSQLRPGEPVKRAMLQRDLWAVFDFYASRNIARHGDKETRRRRDDLCRKLAVVIRGLTLSPEEIASLPDNYAAAVKSGRFATEHRFDPAIDYLPAGLLANPDEWQEIDFFYPKDVTNDIRERFVTLHTRSYLARSYYRIFYRFPGGRTALENYLRAMEAEGIDWKKSAQHGSASIRKDAPTLPVGTEVALVQLLITLDDRLIPTPTPIVESVQLRTFRNVDGSSEPPTSTGVGMNVYEYTLKRRLLFHGLKDGGLERTPDDQPIYRVIMQGPQAPDWGDSGRSLTLMQDCRRCHTGAGQIGVQTMPSIVHSGGFDAGAQMGASTVIPAGSPSPRGPRAVLWKTRHETYRRLLDDLGE
ncbi:MAG: hypothetical protein U0872_10710 [Planctomycetaceae bacterium]